MDKINLTDAFNFAVTFQHPLAKRGLIEMVPTAWVNALSNPERDDKTELIPVLGAPLVSLQELWENMVQVGMRDPFILSAGRHTRKCRLEAGNHRILMFSQMNVPYIPAVVLVGDSPVIHRGNGVHEYERELLIPAQDFSNVPYDEHLYMAPSSVFAELAVMKKAGLLPAPAII